jgi:hypothetical protein
MLHSWKKHGTNDKRFAYPYIYTLNFEAKAGQPQVQNQTENKNKLYLLYLCSTVSTYLTGHTCAVVSDCSKSSVYDIE